MLGGPSNYKIDDCGSKTAKKLAKKTSILKQAEPEHSQSSAQTASATSPSNLVKSSQDNGNFQRFTS